MESWLTQCTVVPRGTFMEGGEKASPCIVTSKFSPCGPVGLVEVVDAFELQDPAANGMTITAHNSNK
jgi:hypothetical protein